MYQLIVSVLVVWFS